MGHLLKLATLLMGDGRFGENYPISWCKLGEYDPVSESAFVFVFVHAFVE